MALLLLFGVVSASAQAPTEEVEVIIYEPEILEVYPHDASAYTQGLLLHEGYFYESTGLRGQSTLRKVEPETGEVLQQIPIDDIYFAEGLALVEDQLIQITWQEQVAFVYDLETFELVDTFEYEGEGWGLCYDGEVLYMSDGSSNLFVRDAETFELVSELPVTLFDSPISDINELECVGDYIYANVWQQDVLIQIDKTTGAIIGVVDASMLLTPEEYAAQPRGGVLNGIAYDEENDVFYITGKLWPKLFEVRFVEREE